MQNEQLDGDVGVGIQPGFKNVGMDLLAARRVVGVDVALQGRGKRVWRRVPEELLCWREKCGLLGQGTRVRCR